MERVEVLVNDGKTGHGAAGPGAASGPVSRIVNRYNLFVSRIELELSIDFLPSGYDSLVLIHAAVDVSVRSRELNPGQPMDIRKKTFKVYKGIPPL